MRATVAVLLLGLFPQADPAVQLNGKITIGTTTYAIRGALNSGGHLLSIELTGGPQPRALVVDKSAGGNLVAAIDGIAVAISSDVAAEWALQASAGVDRPFRKTPMNCETKSSVKTCDSLDFVELSQGVPGRLRLIYRKDRLEEVRFFSLAEWNNSFGETVSVSLSLKRQDHPLDSTTGPDERINLLGWREHAESNCRIWSSGLCARGCLVCG